MAPSTILADLGNSRLKLARLGGAEPARAVPVDDEAAWAAAVDQLDPEGTARWAIATVNPPVADRLRAWLDRRGPIPQSELRNPQSLRVDRWFTSAADVPVRHRLTRPETAGADRALAVLAAIDRSAIGVGGIVVGCGTALTVERIGPDGVWHGGAIAPGLALMARSLRDGTAQLPRIDPTDVPSPWGDHTQAAIAAGLVWGAVGIARELIARQSADLPADRWLIWTGGDAPRLAPLVAGPGARVEADLVLDGLALAMKQP